MGRVTATAGKHSPQEWTESGPEQVAPGVHRVPLPLPMDGLRAVNVYAIRHGDEITVILSLIHI